MTGALQTMYGSIARLDLLGELSLVVKIEQINCPYSYTDMNIYFILIFWVLFAAVSFSL